MGRIALLREFRFDFAISNLNNIGYVDLKYIGKNIDNIIDEILGRIISYTYISDSNIRILQILILDNDVSYIEFQRLTNNISKLDRYLDDKIYIEYTNYQEVVNEAYINKLIEKIYKILA